MLGDSRHELANSAPHRLSCKGKSCQHRPCSFSSSANCSFVLPCWHRPHVPVARPAKHCSASDSAFASSAQRDSRQVYRLFCWQHWLVPTPEVRTQQTLQNMAHESQICLRDLSLTSAARAAALRGSSGPGAPSGDPNTLPGVLDVIFCGSGALVGGGAAALCPRTLPVPAKLSSLLADLEQILPMVTSTVVLCCRCLRLFSP